MMLRSSSTPVLNSLLCSLSDSSPNTNNLHPQSLSKLPYHQSGCLNLTSVCCNSSPISPSLAEISSLRRAQSEGNLEGLAYASCNSNGENQISGQPKKFSGRTKCLMLETIPSFSFYNSKARHEDDDDEEEEEESDIEDGEDEAQPKEHLTIGHGQIGLTNMVDNMVLSENMRLKDRHRNVKFEGKRGLVSEEMYLAIGLGIDSGINSGNGGGSGGRGGGGGGSEFDSAGGDGRDMQGTEEYYKSMVQENPGNPLFLRNYAQFLYESKRDLEGAEEYYSRALLADPKDGEVLSQYAKIVWELHHDEDRASSYFERAVQASPEDSHVHAAYASFLWETEEDEDECSVPKEFDAMGHFHDEAMASAGA